MTTGRPGAAHIALPYDLQKQALPIDDPQAAVWADPALARFPAYRTGPDPDLVRAAAALILRAERPVLVCGGGVVVSGAFEQLRSLAEWLDAPVCSTVSGHGVIPDAHPLAVGVVGANGGTDETRDVLASADLVLFVGCRAGSTTTEHGTVPSRQVPVVHLDIDPMVVGGNYRADVGLVCDARLGLDALLRELRARMGRCETDAAARIAALLHAKRARFERLAQSDETPIRPERVLASLQRVLPADAIVVADPGTPCPYFSGHYRFDHPGRQFITNRAHGALGFALPAAIGAQIAAPDRRVVAAMGDGSFGFAVGELETAVRLNLPIIYVVFSNASFGWIKASQKSGYGQRYFSVDFNRSDHARIAEAFGLKTWTLRDPAECDAVFAAALRHDGPTLIDVIAQPLEQSAVPVSRWMG
jgi:acetolactate synthase-1/2/3 large subunit